MMTPTDDRNKNRIRHIASLLYQASRSIRVLGSIDWPPEVKAEFFAKRAQELPRVSYQPLDPTPVIEAVREARRSIVPVTTVDLWLERQADALERSARMLAAVGTNAFFEYGRQIYGEPTAPHRFVQITSLQLAEHVSDTIEKLARIEMDISPPEYHDAPPSPGISSGRCMPISERMPPGWSWWTGCPPTPWPPQKRSAFVVTPASPIVTPANSCITRPISTALPP